MIRKLRAGVMPPPDVPRPPLAEYEGLRDWLEAEIDRAAAARPNPGRGGAAPAEPHRVRQRHPRSARSRDRRRDAPAAGRLGARLRQHRRLADDLADAARVVRDRRRARRAHGRRLLEVADRGDLPRVERRVAESAPRRACRSGRAAASWRGTTFRPTANTSSRFRTLASAASSPASSWSSSSMASARTSGRIAASALPSGMTADTDGTLEVTVPVRAGSRLVGATFIATNYRPSLDIIRQYDRKSLENNTIPQLQYYPAIGFVRIQGPFNAQRPQDSPSRREGLHAAGPRCRTGQPSAEEAAVREANSTTLARRAYRRPPTAQEIATLLTFFARAARTATFDDGIELALRLAAGESAVPRACRAGAGEVRAGTDLPHHRSRAGVAAVVLPLEQHSGRRVDHGRQPGTPQPAARARAAGAAHAGRSARRRRWSRTSRSSCCICATCRRRRPTASSTRTGTTSCARASSASRSCSSTASCARTATSSTC